MLLLLPTAGCGPSCPTAREWRADLRPELVASDRRIVLETNVIGQVWKEPPTLFVRIEGQSPRPLKMVVLRADGKTALTLDAKPEQNGSYRLVLSLPGGEPLPAGVSSVCHLPRRRGANWAAGRR